MLNNFDARVGFMLFHTWILSAFSLYGLLLVLLGYFIFYLKDENIKTPAPVVQTAILVFTLGGALYFTPVFTPYIQKLEREPVLYPEIVFKKAGIKLSGVKKDQVKAEPGKNLVVIFMESLENSFMNEKSFPGLTPNLNLFAGEGLSFTNIDNGLNTDSTFPALYSIFMGLPLLQEQLGNVLLWQGGLQDRYGKDLPSLPFILHKAGYEQLFLQGPSLKFAGTNVLLEREKIDSAFAYENSGKTQSPTAWGCSDGQLFDWGTTHFNSLAESGKPFALYLMTVDTHLPAGFIHENSEQYPWKNEKEKRFLSAVRTTDREIGKFITRLRRSKAWSNTVVVLITDHLLSSSNVDALLSKNPRRRHIGIVLNSGRRAHIDTAGTAADWGPTVLALLDVRHNHVFPLGENLLEKTNAARLEMSEKQKKMIFCFLAKHETFSHETSVSVTDSPYWALQYNGRNFPFCMENGTYTPDRENMSFILLNMKREPETFIVGNRPLPEYKTKDKEFLVFGHTEGSIKKMFDHVALPANQWCLARFTAGSTKYVCSGDLKQLKLDWSD